MSRWRAAVLASLTVAGLGLTAAGGEAAEAGSVAAMIERAKRIGTPAGPGTVSHADFYRGMQRLGAAAIPEALAILRQGSEPPRVLAALLDAVVQLDDAGDPRIREELCRAVHAGDAGADAGLDVGTEEVPVLQIVALESLLRSGYRCEGAFGVALELYGESSDVEVQGGLIAVMAALADRPGEVEALRRLRGEEDDERLRDQLDRAIRGVEERRPGGAPLPRPEPLPRQPSPSGDSPPSPGRK